MSAGKLTEAQWELLDIACRPAFRVDGLYLFGAAAHRTARSLERRGLGRVSVDDQFVPNEAGRKALEAGRG